MPRPIPTLRPPTLRERRYDAMNPWFDPNTQILGRANTVLDLLPSWIRPSADPSQIDTPIPGAGLIKSALLPFVPKSKRILEGLSQEAKIGAGQLLNKLKGLGVGAEELAEAGIEKAVKGQKSITPKELLPQLTPPNVDVVTSKEFKDWVPEQKLGKVAPQDYEVKKYKLADPLGAKRAELHRRRDELEDEYTKLITSSRKIGPLAQLEPGIEQRLDEIDIEVKKVRDELDSISTKPTGIKAPPDKWPEFHANWLGEENYPILHTRSTTLQTPTGEKVHAVNEIQSDLHQGARKLGYKNPEVMSKVRQLEEELQTADGLFRAASESLRRSMSEVGYPSHITADEIVKLSDNRGRIEKELEQARKESGYIPDIPFKESWPLLGFKTELESAVKKNADWITIATGSDVSKTLSLEHSVKKIQYDPNSSTLRFTDMDGVEHHKYVDPQELPNYVGQEPAARLNAQIQEQKSKRDIARQQGLKDYQSFVSILAGAEGRPASAIGPSRLSPVPGKRTISKFPYPEELDPAIEFATRLDLLDPSPETLRRAEPFRASARQAYNIPPPQGVIEGEQLISSKSANSMRQKYDKDYLNQIQGYLRKEGINQPFQDIDVQTAFRQAEVDSPTGNRPFVSGFRTKAHGLKISDAIKELVKRGQPLYGLGPLALGGYLGRQYMRPTNATQERQF